MAARAFALLCLALLAGCQLGPDYAGPPIVAPRAASAPTFVRAGDAPVVASPPLARWWEALGDPLLSELELRALAANADVAVAGARLRQARATLREQKADLLPSASASAMYAHLRFPGLDLGSLQSGDGQQADPGASDGDAASGINLYNLGFDASWEVDLFGGQRRAIQAARANAEAAMADLADAQVSVTAEVAQAYVDVRDRQQRLALAERVVALQEQMLALTQQRFERGTASRLDIERLRQQLDATRADATPLRAELDAYLDELATLLGEEPGALDSILTPAMPLPLPPAQVAIGDPAALLRRRPDIRAAERTLAADTAKIGQAEADRFPKLSIMGIVGIGGTSASDLTHLDDFTALLAPQLSWSFLDFGRTAAKVRVAKAVRDEADAKYRAAILTALRDAEDALSRFRNRRSTVATLARAEASAGENVILSHQRFAAGTLSRIDMLDAERVHLQRSQDLSAAKAQLTGDFVAIQKALGLGWTSESDTAVP